MKRVRITPGFVAAICLLGWCSLSLCGWFLLAMALHEAGHMAALVLFHHPVRGVTLGAGGAKIETDSLSNHQEWLTAAAGPAVNLALAGLLCRVTPAFALVSLGLAAVNLLPLYPLDGGRILRAILMTHLPAAYAARILRWVIWVTCSTLMIGACWLTIQCQAGIWPIFAALVLLCRAGNAASEIN